MSIRFRCENCGQKLRVAEEKAGQSAKCPRCKRMLTVPPVSSEPEVPATNSPAVPVDCSGSARPLTVTT